jgi:5'-nucleotidase
VGRWCRVLFVCVLSGATLTCAPRTGAPRTAGAPDIVDIQLLAFNDFHGSLDPVAGSNGRIGVVDAGGVEFLATHLARLRAANPNTLIVAAGDNIGASTLLSGMFHDEPTIEALSEAGVDISTVGNHEFDEGWAELYRMQTGGCHPVDGCQDKTPFAGARFEFLSANVLLEPSLLDPRQAGQSKWRLTGTGPQTLFPAFTIKELSGIKVGFIGLVTQTTPDIVSPEGLRGVTFGAEVDAGNRAAAALALQGVKSIVVVIHEGGTPATEDPNGCGVSGPIVDIVNGLSDDVDVVISGHTHESYVCTIDSKLVTSAESLGRLITDIDIRVDRRTGDVVSKRAENVIVTRDVAKSADVTRLLEHYRPFYASLGNRPIGAVTEPITRAANAAGESPLGAMVADAFLEAGRAVDRTAVFSLVNPGSLRSDVTGRPPAADGGPRPVVYADAFDTLPFGNRIIVRTLTGEALLRMLEQQFDNPSAPSSKMLQVAGELTYAHDFSKPAGQRIDRASVMIAGRSLDPAARYRIVSNDFVWGGGDAFTAAKEATDPQDAGVDAETLVAYFDKHSPIAPPAQNRIHTRSR